MKKLNILLISAVLLIGSVLGSGIPNAFADHPARPVKTEAEAMKLARHWADDAKLVGLTLGEIKALRLAYVVDLVEADEPELHANHLFIRKEDGFVALIYPAHNAPKLNREHQLGLEGLAGMAGMSGMSGASQAKPGTRINNDRDARKQVGEWLRSNGIEEEFSLEDVTSMNNVFVVDLYQRKAHKMVNQAVVRGVDGYVALIRPVKGMPTLPTLSNLK